MLFSIGFVATRRAKRAKAHVIKHDENNPHALCGTKDTLFRYHRNFVLRAKEDVQNELNEKVDACKNCMKGL